MAKHFKKYFFGGIIFISVFIIISSVFYMHQINTNPIVIFRDNYDYKYFSRIGKTFGITGEDEESVSIQYDDLPACPKYSPYLKNGTRKGDHRYISRGALEKLFCDKPSPPFDRVKIGGRYRPPTCKPSEKVAIIIPYRNRYEHLHILLHNLIPTLRRQQVDFRVFVIEQDVHTTFNRGILLNIGFHEALKNDNYTCFVFSDVDLFPLNDHALYRCHPKGPVHLVPGISKFNYSLPYASYFGGVTIFSREQYEAVNGNSNLYFGWGGEDDDLYKRVIGQKYKVIRPPVTIGIFDMIKHSRDQGNEENPIRFCLLKFARLRQHIEGLNTALYRKTKEELLPLYTWIHVFINTTQNIQDANNEVEKIVIR